MQKNVISIGRSSECDICVNPEWRTVSNRHADIEFEGNRVYFIDHSSNGTLINNQVVHNNRVEIEPADTILLAGKCKLDWSDVEPYRPRATRIVEEPTETNLYIKKPSEVDIQIDGSEDPDFISPYQPQGVPEKKVSPLAAIGIGLGICILGAIIIALLAHFLHRRIFIIYIVIGLAAGGSLRLLNGGKPNILLGILGAVIACISCMAGDILYVVADVSSEFKVSFWKLLSQLPFEGYIEVIKSLEWSAYLLWFLAAALGFVGGYLVKTKNSN